MAPRSRQIDARAVVSGRWWSGISAVPFAQPCQREAPAARVCAVVDDGETVGHAGVPRLMVSYWMATMRKCASMSACASRDRSAHSASRAVRLASSAVHRDSRAAETGLPVPSPVSQLLYQRCTRASTSAAPRRCRRRQRTARSGSSHHALDNSASGRCRSRAT
jgi:hypothetical protein